MSLIKSVSRCLATMVAASSLAVAAAHAAAPPNVQSLTPITTGLKAPVRVVADAAGAIFVADPLAGGIVKLAQHGGAALDLDGKPIRIATTSQTMGMALTAAGNLLVSQKSTVLLYTRNAKNNFDPSPAQTIQPDGGFQQANGIAVAPDGTIFVADSGAHKIYRFSAQYALLGSFGTQGSALGQFNLPTALAYEKSNKQLAVVDSLNGRVQFFTPTGGFVNSIGTRSVDPYLDIDTIVNIPVALTSPQGIAFEYSSVNPALLERMYVVDTYQSRVQVIDPATSQRLAYIGSYGYTKGSLTQPADIAFDGITKRLFVANGFGNVVPFSIDGGTTPTTDTPPVLTLNLPASNQNAASFTLTGMVDKAANIAVTVGSGSATVGQIAMTSVNDWSVPISGLQNGSLTTFNVTATSLRGAVSATKSFSVTYQASGAPTLTVNPFTPFTAGSSFTITGTKDAVGTIAANAGSPAIIYPTTTTWSATFASLNNGTNNFTLTATNTGLSTSTSVDIAINRINASLFQLPENSIVSSPAQNISGTVAGVEEVTVTLNGGTPVKVPVIGGIFSTAVILNNGSAADVTGTGNTIVVTATDSAGISTSSTLHLVYDPSAPAIDITAMTYGSTINIQDGATIPDNALVKTTIKDPTTNSYPAGTVAVYVDNSGTSATDNSDGTWTTQALAAGIRNIIATVTNNGATTAVKRTVNVVASSAVQLTMNIADAGDATKVIASDTLTALTQLSVGGFAANAVSIGATVNGVAVPVVFNAKASGNLKISDQLTLTPWEYRLSVPFELTTEGNYVITVTALDLNGAVTAVTRTLRYSQTPPQMSGVTTTAVGTTIVVGTGLANAYWLNISGTPQTLAIPAAASGGFTTFTFLATNPNYDQIIKTITFEDTLRNSSRNGRIIGASGEPSVQDVIYALKIAVHGITGTTANLLIGDVAPLSAPVPQANGVVKYTSTPDGVIDINDVRAIFYRVIGLATW